MINAVQQNSFVLRLQRKIWLGKQPLNDGQAGLCVVATGIAKRLSQANEPLRGDRAGGGVDRLVVVERVR